MDEMNAYSNLRLENQWWDGLKPAVPAIARSELSHYLSIIEKNRILTIIGPRRVGKTTLCMQIISELLKTIEPKNILYASLDRTYLDEDKPLVSALGIYQSYVAKETIYHAKEAKYLFLDEVTFDESWALALKEIYDRNANVKIVATGSSAPNMKEKNAAALTGRAVSRIILPLKFRDFLRFRHPDIDWQKLGRGLLRPAILDAIKGKNHEKYYNCAADVFSQASISGPAISGLNEYFLYGGYPESVSMSDWNGWSNRLSGSYFEEIISKDIVRVFKIRNPTVLRKLYFRFARQTCDIANMDDLGSDLGISKPALYDYIYYLESAFLIYRSAEFTKKNKEKLFSKSKYYALDIGMRNAVLGYNAQNLAGSEIGKCAETVAATHIARLKFALCNCKDSSLYHYRENGKEIDFVLDTDFKPMPIEVKFQNDPQESDWNTLDRFAMKYDSPFSILLTKNKLAVDMERKRMAIPLWLFALGC